MQKRLFIHQDRPPGLIGPGQSHRNNSRNGICAQSCMEFDQQSIIVTPCVSFQYRPKVERVKKALLSRSRGWHIYCFTQVGGLAAVDGHANGAGNKRGLCRANNKISENAGGHMRYLFLIIMALLLATPAFAEHLCNITGPHNCNEQINEQLVNITKRTAARVSHAQDQHPFKTENDYILAANAKQIKCVYVAMLAK